MSRAPNSNSLRSEVIRLMRDDRKTILSRQGLANGFGVTVKAVDRVVAELRKEGLIVMVRGYQLAENVELPAIKPRQTAGEVRERSEPSQPAPRPDRIKDPRVASVFDLGPALLRGTRVAV